MVAHYVLADKILTVDNFDHSLRIFKYGQTEPRDIPTIIKIQLLKNFKN